MATVIEQKQTQHEAEDMVKVTLQLDQSSDL